MARSFSNFDFASMEDDIRLAIEKRAERRPKASDPFLPGDIVRLDAGYALVTEVITTSVVRVAPVFKYGGQEERSIDSHTWSMFLHEHFLVFERTIPICVKHLHHTGIASDPDAASCIRTEDNLSISQMVGSLSEDEYINFHFHLQELLKLSKKYSSEAVSMGLEEYEESEAAAS